MRMAMAEEKREEPKEWATIWRRMLRMPVSRSAYGWCTAVVSLPPSVCRLRLLAGMRRTSQACASCIMGAADRRRGRCREAEQPRPGPCRGHLRAEVSERGVRAPLPASAIRQQSHPHQGGAHAARGQSHGTAVPVLREGSYQLVTGQSGLFIGCCLSFVGCLHVPRLQDGGYAAPRLFTGPDRLQEPGRDAARPELDIHGPIWFWQIH